MGWQRAWIALFGLCACLPVAIAPACGDDAVRSGSGTWLGVLIDDESLDGGIQLVAVIPGGPAESAGLERGDVLLEANGRGLVGTRDLAGVLATQRPGDPLRIQLLRGGLPLEFAVRLVPRPQSAWTVAPPAPASAPRLDSPGVVSGPASRYGLAVAEVTPDLRLYYGAPPDLGVLVTRVTPGRPAHRAGLLVGDVLVELGAARVRRVADVDAALEAWRAGDAPRTAALVRDHRRTTVRLEAPAGDRPESARIDVRGAEVALEALERSIEVEIDRLSRRIAALERRLERVREDRSGAAQAGAR